MFELYEITFDCLTSLTKLQDTFIREQLEKLKASKKQ